MRAPILRAFGDARAPDETRRWVGEISRWRFERVATSHFAGPVRCTPAEFRAAFGWLFDRATGLKIADEDWATLDGLNAFIADNKLGAPVLYDYR